MPSCASLCQAVYKQSTTLLGRGFVIRQSLPLLERAASSRSRHSSVSPTLLRCRFADNPSADVSITRTDPFPVAADQQVAEVRPEMPEAPRFVRRELVGPEIQHLKGQASLTRPMPAILADHLVGRQRVGMERGAGVDARRVGRQAEVLACGLEKTRSRAGEIRAVVGDDAGEAAVGADKAGLEPVMGEVQPAGRFEQGESAPAGGDAEDVVPGVTMLVVGGQPEQGGVAGTR